MTAHALQKWQLARHGLRTEERGTPPANRRASLTHAEGLVACALASEGAVGVDAEWLGGLADLSAVARHALAPGEQECLRIVAPGEARGLFMRFWTAKEAVSKALGQGLALPFEGIVLALDPFRVTALPPACGRPQEWHLEERSVGDYRLALALRRPEGRGVVVRWETVTLERLVGGA
ncbi:4'-phosphopantetheinyl transferase family protein [Roseomonas sp. GCM10028921]